MIEYTVVKKENRGGLFKNKKVVRSFELCSEAMAEIRELEAQGYRMEDYFEMAIGPFFVLSMDADLDIRKNKGHRREKQE